MVYLRGERDFMGQSQPGDILLHGASSRPEGCGPYASPEEFEVVCPFVQKISHGCRSASQERSQSLHPFASEILFGIPAGRGTIVVGPAATLP